MGACTEIVVCARLLPESPALLPHVTRHPTSFCPLPACRCQPHAHQTVPAHCFAGICNIIYMYIHMYICRYIYIYIYIYIYVYTYILVCDETCFHLYKYIDDVIYVYMCIHTYIHASVHICTHAYKVLYMYIYI